MAYRLTLLITSIVRWVRLSKFLQSILLHLAVYGTLGDKYPERHARFASKPDYSARHVEKSKLEKYAKDFSTVYNAAWAQHGEAKEISPEQALKLFNKMKPIMDEALVWFAYYKDEPIGMWINIPT
jgi:hypothetical protein